MADDQQPKGRNGSQMNLDPGNDNSVERSLEDFIARANASFLDLDGWDLTEEKPAKPPALPVAAMAPAEPPPPAPAMRARATSQLTPQAPAPATAQAAPAVAEKRPTVQHAATPAVAEPQVLRGKTGPAIDVDDAPGMDAGPAERTVVTARPTMAMEAQPPARRPILPIVFAAAVGGGIMMFLGIKLGSNKTAEPPPAPVTAPAAVTAQPEPAVAAPAPAVAPTPVAAQPLPEAAPVAAPPEPVAAPPEPVAAQPEPVAAQPEPAPAAPVAVALPEPTPAPKAKPAAAKPAAAKPTKPAAAKPAAGAGKIADPFGDSPAPAPKKKPAAKKPAGGIVDPF